MGGGIYGSVMAVVMAHIQPPPPKPRTLNGTLPRELETVILRALEKDPARRWQGMDELLEALSAVSARTETAA